MRKQDYSKQNGRLEKCYPEHDALGNLLRA
jgi:hypothetical protein